MPTDAALLPGAQAVHTCAPGALKEPAAHAAHCVAPVPLIAVPPLQGGHSDAPACDCAVPGAQGVQPAAPPSEKPPAAHARQEVAPLLAA